MSVGSWLVPPPDNLRHRTNSENRGRLNRPGNDDLIPLRGTRQPSPVLDGLGLRITSPLRTRVALFRGPHQGHGFGSGHRDVPAVEVSHFDGLVVRNAKVDRHNRPATASPQLADPLMGHREALRDRQGIDAPRPKATLAYGEPAPSDRRDVAVSGQMNESGHRQPCGFRVLQQVRHAGIRSGSRHEKTHPWSGWAFRGSGGSRSASPRGEPVTSLRCIPSVPVATRCRRCCRSASRRPCRRRTST